MLMKHSAKWIQWHVSHIFLSAIISHAYFLNKLGPFRIAVICHFVVDHGAFCKKIGSLRLLAIVQIRDSLHFSGIFHMCQTELCNLSCCMHLGSLSAGCSSGYLVDTAWALDRNAVDSCKARSWFISYKGLMSLFNYCSVYVAYLAHSKRSLFNSKYWHGLDLTDLCKIWCSMLLDMKMFQMGIQGIQFGTFSWFDPRNGSESNIFIILVHSVSLF